MQDKALSPNLIGRRAVAPGPSSCRASDHRQRSDCQSEERTHNSSMCSALQIPCTWYQATAAMRLSIVLSGRTRYTITTTIRLPSRTQKQGQINLRVFGRQLEYPISRLLFVVSPRHDTGIVGAVRNATFRYGHEGDKVIVSKPPRKSCEYFYLEQF